MCYIIYKFEREKEKDKEGEGSWNLRYSFDVSGINDLNGPT